VQGKSTEEGISSQETLTSAGNVVNSQLSTSTDTALARAAVCRIAVRKPVGYENPLIQYTTG